MTRPLILVTGASGNTGSAVATELLAKGMAVRILVRRLDDRAQALRRLGAEVAIADLNDRRQVNGAMAGVQRAWFVPPYAATMAHSARIFAELAAAHRLEAVAVMSQWIASPDHPALLTRLHAEVDAVFAQRPEAFIAIAPGYFADNYLRLIDFAGLLGILPNLTGNSRNAPPSNEDIARVAAATLVDPAPHIGQRYRPTGPELLNVPEMAAILSTVLGHKVRSVPMPFWLFLKAARLQGVPAFDLDSLSYYVRDHREGAFALGAPNDHVLRVTGQPAEPFAVTAARYARLPKAQRSPARVLQAWLDFMRTPFSPGLDLARYERQAGFAQPALTRYAMDNGAWRSLVDAG
ncbi:MAG: transcriptional regulator [Alphaproteobacteria bacterium PA4]|nr:MAG: transcriptional regulator [Alphaproteobacteria bacterium PA4]